MVTIVFAGGGSGGHLFPGVAVAQEFTQRASSIRSLFIGSDRPVEKQILEPTGYEHIALPVLPSSRFFKSPFASTLANWRAYVSARRILKQTTPEVVVGLGGFASVPVVVAAWRFGIPVVLLEQNAVLGRANRVLLPFARRICLSIAGTPIPSRYQNIAVLTGNPVRREIAGSREGQTPLAAESPCLLVLGGSQGATAVNESIVQALPELRTEIAGWAIIHQTGSRDWEKVKLGYSRAGIEAQVVPFLNDLGAIYPKTMVVVSRAGGTSLAELALHGIPSLLIPYPGSIRNHQLRNAEYYARSGGAIIVDPSKDSSALANELSDSLGRLLTQPDLRATMGRFMKSLGRPDAARLVSEWILESCSAMHKAA